ncbi:MAG: hypothetical protein ACKOCT_08575 [Alphaproteobacteria bacterium]
MRIVATTIFTLLGLAAVAEATTIADVAANGESLNGQQVTVVGRVAEPRSGYAGETIYTITDGEHRLTVLGKGDPPAVGTQLSVSGKVAWREGDEEFTWPPVLVGATSQVKP